MLPTPALPTRALAPVPDDALDAAHFLIDRVVDTDRRIAERQALGGTAPAGPSDEEREAHEHVVARFVAETMVPQPVQLQQASADPDARYIAALTEQLDLAGDLLAQAQARQEQAAESVVAAERMVSDAAKRLSDAKAAAAHRADSRQAVDA